MNIFNDFFPARPFDTHRKKKFISGEVFSFQHPGEIGFALFWGGIGAGG